MAEELVRTDVNVLSLDWRVRLDEVRRQIPDRVALQGNLDPTILNTKPEIVRKETKVILDSMAGDPAFIFNLGHGILPGAKIENVEALVETVSEYRPQLVTRT